MSERKTVKVACQHVGGLRISVEKRGEDDGTGFRPLVEARHVVLAGPSALAAGVGSPSSGEAVITEVDADFWQAYVEQGAGKNPLLNAGLIHEVD